MDYNYNTGLDDESQNDSFHRPETPPPQYSDIPPPPPRGYAATNANATSHSYLEAASSTGNENQRTLMEQIVDDPENQRSSFDPQQPSTWKGAKWADIKQQWKERHHGPREPKDPWTGRGKFTGLTPEELKAKCENYGTLLPKGQRRR
jgi:hypothetical protein